MLAFYQRWAQRLYPVRQVFILLFMAALAMFAWLLFAATTIQAQHWQLPSVLLAVSSLLLWLWATLFSQPLPALQNVSGMAARLKLKLQYLLYYTLCLVISVLLLATLYLGLRVFKGIISTLFFS